MQPKVIQNQQVTAKDGCEDSVVRARSARSIQIVTKRSAYYYAKQEVLITCDPSGAISAWFDGNLLTLKEIEKRPKQGTIVSSKSTKAQPVVPAYNHPWRTYGKKINGKPILTTLSTE